MRRSRAAVLMVVTVILAMLGHLAVLAYGSSVRISWDPNDPAPEGYRVFQRGAGQSYDYSAPAWQGPESPATIDAPPFGVAHYYVVRAYDGDLESEDSEEVFYTMTPVPAPAIIHIGEKK